MTIHIPQDVEAAQARVQHWRDWAYASFTQEQLPVYFQVNGEHHRSMRSVITPLLVRSLVQTDAPVERDGITYPDGSVIILSTGDRFTVQLVS